MKPTDPLGPKAKIGETLGRSKPGNSAGSGFATKRIRPFLHLTSGTQNWVSPNCVNLGVSLHHLLKDLFEGRKLEDGKPVSTQQRKNAA